MIFDTAAGAASGTDRYSFDHFKIFIILKTTKKNYK